MLDILAIARSAIVTRPGLGRAMKKKAERMPTVTFFPLGNADSSLITLENGKRLLFSSATKATQAIQTISVSI